MTFGTFYLNNETKRNDGLKFKLCIEYSRTKTMNKMAMNEIIFVLSIIASLLIQKTNEISIQTDETKKKEKITMISFRNKFFF